MNLSEINNIINDVISEEIRKTIIMESTGKEVYHIKCDGEPIATFDSEEEAQEALPDYKAKNTGELIIEKGMYESYEDMIDKLDEMGEKLEETDEINEFSGNQEEPYEGMGDVVEELKEKAQQLFEKGAIDDQELYEIENIIDNNIEEYWDASMDGGIDVKNMFIQIVKDVAPHLIRKKKKENTNMENQEPIDEKLVGKQKNIDKNDNGKIDSEDFKMLNKEEEECDECGEMNEDDMEGMDSFGDDYENLPDGESPEDEVNEEPKMCSECGGMMNEEGACNECGGAGMYESKKKTLRLKESEMLDMIQRIVKESVPGITVTKKAQTQSKKDNEANASDVAKKIKGATTFDGNDNPEFPKSIGKGEKVARKNSPEQEEEIEDNRGGGLEDLHYDIEPSQQFKDRLKKSLDGHTSTGNSQDAGNVIKSDLGKNIAKKVERKMKQRKDMVMYNKDVQPTKVVKESKNNLSSILEEEIKKMKNIATYDKKTQ
jgi:hypothetical protein